MKSFIFLLTILTSMSLHAEISDLGAASDFPQNKLIVVSDFDFTLAVETKSYSKFLQIVQAHGLRRMWYELKSRPEFVLGMPEVLQMLVKKGARLYILSNRNISHKSWIERTLAQFDIRHDGVLLPKHVVGSVSLFKRQSILDMSDQNRDSNFLFIGDNMEKDSETFSALQEQPSLREKIKGIFVRNVSERQIAADQAPFRNGIDLVSELQKRLIFSPQDAIQVYQSIAKSNPERIRCAHLFKLFDGN